MSEFTTSVRDDGEERRIQRAALLLSDLRSFWPIVARLFRSWESRQFESEGGFFGDGWAPLSPSYAARKQAVRPGKPLLVFDGALKRAATSPVRRVTPRSLTLIITDPKAGIHQEGDEARGLPARPLIPSGALPPVAQAELDEAARGYVSDILGRTFGRV